MSTPATVRLTGVLDPREGWKAERCTIAKAVDVLSTRSAMLILREAFYGTTRFDEFAERVGISEPVTAARLRELVDEGLLEREEYREPGQRTRRQYRLTEKGAELFPPDKCGRRRQDGEAPKLGQFLGDASGMRGRAVASSRRLAAAVHRHRCAAGPQ